MSCLGHSAFSGSGGWVLSSLNKVHSQTRFLLCSHLGLISLMLTGSTSGGEEMDKLTFISHSGPGPRTHLIYPHPYGDVHTCVLIYSFLIMQKEDRKDTT